MSLSRQGSHIIAFATRRIVHQTEMWIAQSDHGFHNKSIHFYYGMRIHLKNTINPAFWKEFTLG